jgi:hypothetical protein
MEVTLYKRQLSHLGLYASLESGKLPNVSVGSGHRGCGSIEAGWARIENSKTDYWSKEFRNSVTKCTRTRRQT